MAAFISYQDEYIKLNNRSMEHLIQLVIESAELDTKQNGVDFIDKLAEFWETEYWTGRGLEIEEDFKDVEEAKFWAISFYNLAKRIFTREVGNHSDDDWQVFMIHRAKSVSEFLEAYVQDLEPLWNIRGLTIDSYPPPPIFNFKSDD